MNNLDKYIHRCRLNLEPHHLQPADETDDKHCIICDISGARRLKGVSEMNSIKVWGINMAHEKEMGGRR